MSNAGRSCGLSVSKEEAQKFHVERFKLTKLTNIDVRKQYQFKIYNRSADLEKSDDRRDINGAWENVEEHTKFSATEGVKP
jgi:hypothetical protein